MRTANKQISYIESRESRVMYTKTLFSRRRSLLWFAIAMYTSISVIYYGSFFRFFFHFSGRNVDARISHRERTNEFVNKKKTNESKRMGFFVFSRSCALVTESWLVFVCREIQFFLYISWPIIVIFRYTIHCV